MVYLFSFFSYSWQGVFSDPDSGMADYKWGIGSQPGYDDKYSFSETVNTCSGTPERQSLALNEGHSYFVTVQVQDLISLPVKHQKVSWGPARYFLGFLILMNESEMTPNVKKLL